MAFWFPMLFSPLEIVLMKLFCMEFKFIVQPGGSKKDEEVIEAANEHGMAMIMTGKRHFRH